MQDLRAILRYLGISDANMEQGNLRCDANISLRPTGQKTLGTKVEIKNINSFKMVERALEYEVIRQTEILETNKKVIQETRGWDDSRNLTISQRNKEEANDYRYFPEPDLPPFYPQDDKSLNLEELKRKLPELPKDKRLRFEAEYGLPETDAETLTSDLDLAKYFESILAEMPRITGNSELKKAKAKKTANWLISELLARLNLKDRNISENKIEPKYFAELINSLDEGEINGSMAKEILDEIVETGASPTSVIKAKGLAQNSNEAELESVVTRIIEENPGPVKDFLEGKEKAFGYLVGQAMAATRGKANPKIINELIRKKLKEEPK